jgi:hypothetical protein
MTFRMYELLFVLPLYLQAIRGTHPARRHAECGHCENIASPCRHRRVVVLRQLLFRVRSS